VHKRLCDKNMKEEDQLEDIGLDGRIILKYIKNYNER
jgi:hypothetical protein